MCYTALTTSCETDMKERFAAANKNDEGLLPPELLHIATITQEV